LNYAVNGSDVLDINNGSVDYFLAMLTGVSATLLTQHTGDLTGAIKEAQHAHSPLVITTTSNATQLAQDEDYSLLSYDGNGM